MNRQPRPADLSLLFVLVGQAIWYVQCVEDALSNTLTVVRDVKGRNGVSLDELREILGRHRRSTLGTALRNAEKASLLPPELLSELRKLKKERDWLVHRLLPEKGDDIYNESAFVAVLERISAIVTESQRLQRGVVTVLEDFVVERGVKRSWLEAYAEERLRYLSEGGPTRTVSLQSAPDPNGAVSE